MNYSNCNGQWKLGGNLRAMAVRALRGAITVDADEPEEIRRRTVDLLTVLFERNNLAMDDVISILFTATEDLVSLPPAAGARGFGLTDVPLLCAVEMPTDGGLKRCIRLMLHVESDLGKSELRHVFLRRATTLRPDLAESGDDGFTSIESRDVVDTAAGAERSGAER